MNTQSTFCIFGRRFIGFEMGIHSVVIGFEFICKNDGILTWKILLQRKEKKIVVETLYFLFAFVFCIDFYVVV